VRIIGDSHLKGATTRINQYVNTKFQVTSIIKTGAGVSQLLHTQDNELKGLGKSDVIIINGGSNDIDKPGCNVNALIAKMFKFVLKYINTNILMVTLPIRHDMEITSKTNASIRAYNSKLKNISNAHNHVSIVDMSLNRNHYTKHGFHMNNSGKEWFAKHVASQIEMLTKLLNESKHLNEPKSVIPLEWKEMVTTLHNNIPNNQEHTKMSTVSDTVETLVPSILTQNITVNTISEPQLQISTRTKMVPRTMSSDFLW
jgi:lysophospholipase L1-like esterase